MKAIDFVVRTGAGTVERGEVSADGSVTAINAGSGRDISINVRQGDVQGYQRLGTNLEVTLADGRIVMLEDFFAADGSQDGHLFISADGYLNEVTLVEGQSGEVYAQYGVTEQWGKWSPSDELIFLDSTEVAQVAAVADEEVSMLGAGLLGGGFLSTGAAVAGGVAVIGGVAGGPGGEDARIEPTVNEDTPIVIGGDDVEDGDKSITITGTAEPDSTVDVTIGDQTVTVTSTDDGTWTATFDGEDFPEDGEHDVTVHVTETDGTETDLTGPSVAIDLVGPDITFTEGTQSVGDLINGEGHADGVEISGTGEIGASIEVTAEGVTHTTTVGEDGTWTVTYTTTELVAGEYETDVTVVSTDTAGNSTTVTDTIVIDTVGAVTIDAGLIEGDDIINAVEASDGVTLTGTSQPGSTVEVSFGTVTHTATVATDGSWSVDFSAGDFEVGTYGADFSVTATDTAGNVSTATRTVQIDTEASISIADGQAGGDDIINAAEADAGITLTGQAEAGSSVEVTLGTVTHTATVAADGSWSVDFTSGEIPRGEQDMTVTATATDGAGNVTSATDTLRLDTDAGHLALSSSPIEGDNIVNFVEASDGVVINGTSDAGAIVEVTLGGVSHTVTTGSNGQWSATFGSHEITQGTYTADITATSTDVAGNTRTVTGTVDVDTQVDNLGISTNAIEGDNVINAVEVSDGVAITGTVEVGSTVSVTIGGVTHPATVDGSGNWTVTFDAGDFPGGEYNADIQVAVTDLAGNTDTVSSSVQVDTLVNELDLSSTPVEGDNIVNAGEASDGITLTGSVEAGSTVSVAFGGVDYPATVASDGSWSVDIPASGIADGEYDADVVISATDAAGNTATTNETIGIDTTVPNSAVIVNYTRGVDGFSAISVEMTDDTLAVHEIDTGNGAVTQLAADSDGVDVFGSTAFGFSPVVPDGSHLVVTSTDDAGNSSGTYLVLDESTTSVVDMSNTNLGDLQIEAIDLQFADESSLTITESELVALSDNSDTVTVHGGSDDTVTITGATNTGQSVDINGETHDVYTLGTEGTLLIDDDITVVI